MPQNSITWIKNTHVLLFMLDVLAKLGWCSDNF